MANITALEENLTAKLKRQQQAVKETEAQLAELRTLLAAKAK